MFGWLFCIAYLLSGVVALSYEVLWTRMFTLLFGVSIFGIAVTVAGFMLGLGGGSMVGAAWVRRAKRPLLGFAVVEALVAAFAFSLPAIVSGLDNGITVVTAQSSLAVWYAVEVIAVFLLMALPAFAMGIGFALAVSIFRQTPFRIGLVYGLNTLGGVLGAILPLLLLPSLGWTVSLRLTAILGFLIAIFATVLLFLDKTPAVESGELPGHATRPRSVDLLAYGAIGAAALILQVGWVRLYGMLLLRTEYVLAILLAVFLAGVGLGSFVGHRLRRDIWLTVLPLAAGTWVVLGLWLVPSLGSAMDSSNHGSLQAALMDAGFWIGFLTFPVTFCLGAWLPLLVKRSQQEDMAGVWFYGANSLGAAIGALAAAFVLTPWIGTTATILLAAVIFGVASLVWVKQPWFRWVPLVFLLVGLPVWSLPEVQQLLPRSQMESNDVFVHEDAIAITHVVQKPSGERLLLADLQRMDASSDPTAVAAQANQARLPLLLHPHPTSVLFLGLGTGITAAGSLPFPGLKRVAVELSQGSVDAARDWFVPVNGHVMDVMTVVRDDARRFLRTDQSHYDVIVGDLFHPDLAGRGALLSRQQFARAKERLAPGGIFVQWVALNQFDPPMLDVVMRTFSSEFVNASIFVDGFRLALVGSLDPLSAANVIVNLERMDANQKREATGGEGPWTWLARYWGPMPRGHGPIQDEWAPVIEFHLPAARYRRADDLPRLLQKLLAERADVAHVADQLAVAEGDRESFDRAYFAVELGLRSWLAGLVGDSKGQREAVRLGYQANPVDRWTSFGLADQVFSELAHLTDNNEKRIALERVLAIRSDHVEALRAMMHLAEHAKNVELVESWRERLRLASPLDAEAGRSK